MLRNYFNIAWRNIVRHRFNSFVNIFGLSIGILFTMLIGGYVWRELNVNRNLRNLPQQYFLRSEWKDPNQGLEITTLGPLAKRLKEDYPNLVANYYRWDGITSVVSNGDKYLRENIQLGDSTFLNMYGIELLHGDARTALNEPFSVVMTREVAIKYFGKTDVVGETIGIQNFSGTSRDFKVTGVLKKIPENSVTNLNVENFNSLFIPTNTFSYFGRFDFEAWANIFLPSYIELQKGVEPNDLKAAINKLIQDNAPDGIKQNITVVPTPLTTYYLDKDNGLIRNMLFALAFVGFFILLMAIVNFINISISSSATRTKEIGIRKVMGGLKNQIMIQFLIESVILVLIATGLALAFYPMTQSLFSDLVGKPIPALSDFPAYFIGFPLLMVLLVGLLAGLYPAIVLASMKSVDSLKGKLQSVKEKIWLRKSLVGFQFTIATIVIIAASVVASQISYFFSGNLGYNKNYVVSAQVPRNWTPAGIKNITTVRNEFERLPFIESATISYEIPNGMNGGQPPVYKIGTDSTTAIAMQAMVTDEKYLETYRIPMNAGRFFETGESDSSKIVLNATAAKLLGWTNPTDAIGRQVRIPGSPIIHSVTGITSDFHFESMSQKIQPIIFFQLSLSNSYRFISFKLRPGNTGESIAAIQQKWATLLPGSSFEYKFMDETLSKLYAIEIQIKKAAYTATVLCLVIVLLGVLGLISLSIQKRVKEIGIRKVVGASIADILALFLKEFVVIILIAGLIACPVAFILMNAWLNNYPYRIELGPLPFLWSIGGLCLITLLVIVARVSKAALLDPAKSLRTE
ncbi:MAG: ABC transporter permease [Chitinophagaceae bacterium]|nr:ABC transporter permease [Chitinophagaceae bacterium]